MVIRPATAADVNFVNDIDATLEAAHYLHVDRAGEGLGRSWRLEPRPLRERAIRSYPLSEDAAFTLKQVASGADDGLALVAEHNEQLVALMLAQPDVARQTLRLIDLRVDYDFRRQGLATAMLFSAISHARETQLRAVATETLTDNQPAAAMLVKSGFELAGIDDHRNSNHDLVKETVTLFWYAAMD
ncbi:MAG TPA: GNAT family N-acetyltransferase [Tepidisphaeraceae bacterium]|jgi:RimJ/RimL family protein N-acetyltransferase|nr:GNAT family N-acetyltransferase [Tepidisphaeraceae bacterium]